MELEPGAAKFQRPEGKLEAEEALGEHAWKASKLEAYTH
jgi:hypothetical protein